MKYTDFIRAYPNEMPPDTLPATDVLPAVEASRAYSFQFGQILHANMSGQAEHPPAPQLDRADYLHWTVSDYTMIHTNFIHSADSPSKLASEVGFHDYNRHMADLWEPIAGQDWESEAERTQTFIVTQDDTALDSILYLKGYRGLQDTGHLHKPSPETHESTLLRRDIGILALEAVRQTAGLTIVPAPIQFKRAPHGASADFVVADYKQRRTIGLRINPANHTTEADPDRIITLNCEQLLARIQLVYAQKGNKRQPTQQPWPGIIAAKKLELTQLLHKSDRLLATANKHVTHRETASLIKRMVSTEKSFSRKLVGSLRIDYRAAVQTIGQQVLERLHA